MGMGVLTMLLRQCFRIKACAHILVILALLSLIFAVSFSIVHAHTYVGGPIVYDTTWTLADSPFIVIENVEVWDGVTLTIQPGVVVKFESGKLMQVSGTLVAQGTVSQPITFTSNQAIPQPGDWGNIAFTATAITTALDAEGNYLSGSILQYCFVEYGGHGAASAIDTRSLLIDHCTVRDNDARGIYDPGSETAPSRITNNTISGNSSLDAGGGIYTENSTVSGNAITANWAETNAGGIYAANSTVNGNTISSNGSLDSGGGIWSEDSTVSGNTISDNWAGTYGGGISAQDSTMSNNTISGNSALDHGGGIHANNSIVSGNAVGDNLAKWQGGGIFASHCTVSNDTVTGNSARIGGGISAWYSTVRDNIASGNSARYGGSSGGGIYARESIVTGNTVRGNSADSHGGGIGVVHSTVSGNSISSNSAALGGGISARFYADEGVGTMVNNLIADNQASSAGSGLYVSGGSTRLVHTTIARNTGGDGSGVLVDSGTVLLTNTILVSQTVGITVAADCTVTLEATLWGTSTWANESDWGGDGTVLTGMVNVWGDLGFVDSGAGDYHVSPGSAALDKGVDTGVLTDIDLQPRPYLNPDLGADEYWPPGVLQHVYLPLLLRAEP
jgi:hypothetical protein